MNNFVTTLLLFGIAFGARAQYDAYQAGFYTKNGDTLEYRYLEPENFDPSKKIPLLLFMHGAGERGSDNQTQLVHGSKLFEDSIAKYPALVVFPQCPKEIYWSNVQIEKEAHGRNHFFIDGGAANWPMKLTMGLVDSLLATGKIDQERVYVGGLSMGGMGTFEIVYRKPDTFAAAFPICGGGNSDSASKYVDTTSFWIFHGAKDDVVLPYHSIKMRKAIADAGGDVKLTIYPEANHNSWDSAFAEPDLLKWIFSQKK